METQSKNKMLTKFPPFTAQQACCGFVLWGAEGGLSMRRSRQLKHVLQARILRQPSSACQHLIPPLTVFFVWQHFAVPTHAFFFLESRCVTISKHFDGLHF